MIILYNIIGRFTYDFNSRGIITEYILFWRAKLVYIPAEVRMISLEGRRLVF